MSNEAKTPQEIMMDDLHEQANKYIAKSLELFNQEPTYGQVVSFICKPLVYDIARTKSEVDALLKGIEATLADYSLDDDQVEPKIKALISFYRESGK
jgi:hypothetical protein